MALHEQFSQYHSWVIIDRVGPDPGVQNLLEELGFGSITQVPFSDAFHAIESSNAPDFVWIPFEEYSPQAKSLPQKIRSHCRQLPGCPRSPLIVLWAEQALSDHAQSLVKEFLLFPIIEELSPQSAKPQVLGALKELSQGDSLLQRYHAVYQAMTSLDWSGAEAQLESWITTDPRNPICRGIFAEFLFASGADAACEEFLRHELTTDKSNRLYRALMASLKNREGQHSYAKSVFQDLVTQNPYHLGHRRSLADTCLALGADDKAIHHLEQILELCPKDPEILRILTALTLREGDNSRSIAYIKKMSVSDDGAILLMLSAKQKEEHGDLTGALEDLLEAQRQASADGGVQGHVCYNLAVLFYKKGAHQESAKWAQASIQAGFQDQSWADALLEKLGLQGLAPGEADTPQKTFPIAEPPSPATPDSTHEDLLRNRLFGQNSAPTTGEMSGSQPPPSASKTGETPRPQGPPPQPASPAPSPAGMGSLGVQEDTEAHAMLNDDDPYIRSLRQFIMFETHKAPRGRDHV